VFAFIATVIAAGGSLVGAVVGGFAVGFVSVMLQAYLPEDLRSFPTPSSSPSSSWCCSSGPPA